MSRGIIIFKIMNTLEHSSSEIQPYALQARLFKVLTHPVRLAILDLLRDGEQCVCHLEAHLGYRQAYISQQLMILREAGLIQDERDGWNVYYRVTEPRIFAVLEALEQIVGQSAARQPVQESVSCACPKCSAKPGR